MTVKYKLLIKLVTLSSKDELGYWIIPFGSKCSCWPGDKEELLILLKTKECIFLENGDMVRIVR